MILRNEVKTSKSKSINAPRNPAFREREGLLVVGSMYSLQLSYMRKAGKINFDEGIIGKTHSEVGMGRAGAGVGGGVGALPYKNEGDAHRKF